jgi:lipopolysaccharide transport system permease protein
MRRTTTAESPDVPLVLILPRRGFDWRRLGELWEHRELFYFLTWRDLKVRYKQTVLGASWAVLQPLLTTVAFSLFFGRLAGIPSDGLPYPLFAFAALVPWSFFSTSLTQASNSVVTSAHLIRKIYFPRLVLPTSAVLGASLDFALSFSALLALMAVYGVAPTARLLVVPLLALLAFVTALGAGIWLAAMQVQFRDIRYVVPFLVQLWLLSTPVAYPTSLVPESWRALYALNPMVGVVEGFRWALLGSDAPVGALLPGSLVASLLLLATGIAYFRRVEDGFADVV